MMGPVIIFDKSTLQSLSVDESCWLENFFLTNLTPISETSEKEMVQKLKKNLKGSVPIDSNFPFTSDDADHVLIERKVLIKKGKWRILPPEVENQNN